MTKPKPDLIKSLNTVLNALNITDVIIIDDVYSINEVNIDSIKAYVLGNLDKVTNIESKFEGLEGTSYDEIVEIIDNLEEEKIKEIESLVIEEGIEGEEEAFSFNLKELFNFNCNFLTLSANDWATKKDEFKDKTILILVDRSFTKEGKSEDFGIELIRNITNEIKSSYCVLITHTVLPDNELINWSEISNSHRINQNRFIVVSKGRIAEDKPDYVGFVKLIKLIGLSGPINLLRENIINILQQAVTESYAALKHWTIHDFEQVVFKSSNIEGVWEGDTLLRVFSNMLHACAQDKLLSDRDLSLNINSARTFSNLFIPGKPKYSWSNVGTHALDYQVTEFYDEKTLINKNNLPIENGDVFQYGTKYYILLAQPCDLMVRNKTGRCYDNNLTRMVPLCEIVIVKDSEDPPRNSYHLPYWNKKGKCAYIIFTKMHLVRLAIIDLCVFNQSGEMKYLPSSRPSINLNSAWGNHHTKLHKQMKKEWNIYKQTFKVLEQMKPPMKKAQKELILKNSLPASSNTNLMNIKEYSSGFKVNLKRSRRLKLPYSADVLKEFSLFQTRAAFNHHVYTEDLKLSQY